MISLLRYIDILPMAISLCSLLMDHFIWKYRWTIFQCENYFISHIFGIIMTYYILIIVTVTRKMFPFDDVIMMCHDIPNVDPSVSFFRIRLSHCPAYINFQNMYIQCYYIWHSSKSWWRHQMETFSALLAICAGNSPVSGEFHAQRPVTRSFDVFFDLRRNKRLSKQWWGWWFETVSSPLWRHCNVTTCIDWKVPAVTCNVSFPGWVERSNGLWFMN